MPLYLHETVDMNNGQIASYFDGLHDEAQPFLAQVGMHMCGFWQVNYSSGRWPEALVIWELADWQAYSAKMRAFRLPETPDPDQSVSRYMELAPVWRSGGFDRLLIPVSWSPTPPTPPTFKSTGGVFFHQTIKVRPGEARAFLAAFEKEVLPRLASVGLTLEGFWRSVFNPFEYIALLSADGWEGYERVQESRLADDDGSQLPGLGAVLAHVTDLQEKILLSSSRSPLGGGVPTLGSFL